MGTNVEINIQFHARVLGNRNLKLLQITSCYNISSEREHIILHPHLSMKKLFAKWVPCILTVIQKRECVTCSMDELQLFQLNSHGICRGFLTLVETFVGWFSDSQEIIRIDYLEMSESIIGTHCVSLTDRLETDKKSFPITTTNSLLIWIVVEMLFY